MPVFHDLSLAVNRPGKSNDLADATADLPRLESRASTAIPAAVAAMQQGNHVLKFLRPYSRTSSARLAAWVAPPATTTPMGTTFASLRRGWGSSTMRRPTSSRSRSPRSSPTTGPGSSNYRVFHRCPGGATQPIAGSNPFLDGGMLTAGPPFPMLTTATPATCSRAAGRIALICAGLLLAAMLIAIPAIGSNGSSGTYKVRGVFDNGSFIVSGEEVRVAGAKVGTVDSVAVSGDDEIVSGEAGTTPSQARPWWSWTSRTPASRTSVAMPAASSDPQSLIGERYVDCTPTQPYASGQTPPPAPHDPRRPAWAGQHLLLLENNGTTVDLDTVQNIQRLPFRDRFRLILNELGPGSPLAARTSAR